MISNRDKAELNTYNYFINGGAESGTAGFATFNTTFSGGLPTTITPGSTKVALTVVNTNVLAGSESAQFACTTASGSTGHGWISDIMSISDADLAKILAIQFDYNFVSGQSNLSLTGQNATQTLQVWVYNVGNNAWTQPSSSNSILTSGTPSQLIPGRTAPMTFQTDVSNASNKNQYRVAWIIRNDPTGPFAMNIDCISMGRQRVSSGAAVTDWKPYNLVIGATVTPPTPGNIVVNHARWRRVGDSMEIYYNFVQNSAGSGGSGVYLFPLPAGYSIDLSKFDANAVTGASCIVGSAAVNFVNFDQVAEVKAYSATQLALLSMNVQTSTFITYVADNNGQLGASDITYTFTARVPIVGWSSNVDISGDYDGRVISFAGTVQTPQALTANVTDIVFVPDAGGNRVGAWFTDHFVCPAPGDYFLSSQASSTGADTLLQAYRNGTVYNYLTQNVPQGSLAFGSLLIPSCKTGDILSVRSVNSLTNFALNCLSITRIAGPTTVAASEVIAARYNVRTSYAFATNSPINFESKVYDTHNAVTTGVGTWKFTAPSSRFYTVSAVTNVNFAAGASLVIRKNGFYENYLTTQVNTNVNSGAIDVWMNEGDYLDMVGDGSNTIGNLGTISIKSK